jgi:nucleoside-diphosphate-sugar epimerase
MLDNAGALLQTLSEGKMRVLITGAGGFVGREICHRLLARGDDVVGIDVNGGGMVEGINAIAGELANPAVRARAIGDGCDALIHLATVPGGAAEADPAASRAINIDAMYDLLLDAAAASPRLRVVYASTIAVFADPLPALVDDQTPISPKMIYGGHKAMMEHAIALFSNRGLIDGVTVRLPGILARPKGPSGMKSAFMSDLFHALKAGETFTCPVSEQGAIWAQSVRQCAINFVHALSLDSTLLPPTRAITLPALRITMGELATEIARQCQVSTGLVSYVPDPALQAAFAQQPPLLTPAAERAGFVHDGDTAKLVANALASI